MNVYTDWLGIPEDKLPEGGSPDHYELLRLPRFEDDETKIEAHYKKLNNHVRAYASGEYGQQSQELLNELAKAKLCLTDPKRKRDYDEAMGREFAEEPDAYGRRPLDAVLVDQGVASRDQVREAEEYADARGLSLRDAVVQMKLANPEQAARALAAHLQRPFVDLKEMPPEDTALDAVPRMTVKKHTILPLYADDGQLVVACADEPSYELQEELEFRYGLPIAPVITTPRSIQQAIATHYPPGTREEAVPPGGVVAETAAAPAKGGKKPKREKAAKEQKGPRAKFSTLDEPTRKQRKQVGAIAMLWSFIVPILATGLLANFGIIRNLPALTYYLVPLPFAAVTVWYVTQRYWKYA